MSLELYGAPDGAEKENVKHGTVAFPAADYNDDLTKDAYPWHWHDELEINVAEKGKVLLNVGKQNIILSEGEGYFVNAGVLHACRNAGEGVCTLRAVVFHPRLVGGSVDSVFWQKYLQPVLADKAFQGMYLSPETDWQREAVDTSLAAWEAIVSKTSGYEFEAREKLSRLIYLVAAHRPPSEIPPSEKVLRDNQRIKIMLQYIEAHYPDEITMADIASSAGISGSECMRCFRAVLDVTPIQYLRQYRIGKAAGLLISTEAKIVDIAVQCGFQEMSYFAKVFREFNGYTPSEYRKVFAKGGKSWQRKQ